MDKICKKCGGKLPANRPDLADLLIKGLDDAGLRVKTDVVVSEVCSECAEDEKEGASDGISRIYL